MRLRCPEMVGRSAELEELISRLPGRSGRGAFVLVGGEAGVGKTRLLEELEAAALAAGTPSLAGGCSQADIKFPYLPYVSAFAQAPVSPDDVRQRLGVHADAVGAVAPRIASNAAGQVPKPMFFESVVMLLEAIAGPTGLVLLVEDLHWADAGTAELTEYLARRIRTEPLLLVASYRSDEFHRTHPLMPTLSSLRRLADLDLVVNPLGVDESTDLVRRLRGGGAIESHLAERLTARAQGNPLFLEELASAASADAGEAVPDSVRHLVLRRFDTLEPEHRAALRAASVIGLRFEAGLLEAVAGDSAGPAIAAGLDHHLILPAAAATYEFRHALVWEAIHLDIVELERRRLHGLVATVLRKSGTAPPETLCLHLFAAGHPQDALPLCLEAAAHAEAVGDFGSAADLYVRALTHAADPVERAARSLAAGRALISAGRIREGAAHLETSAGLWESLGDAGKTIDACRQLADIGGDAGVERLASAIDRHGNAAPLKELGLALNGLAAALMLRNRLEEAESVMVRGTAVWREIEGQGVHMPADPALTMLAAFRGAFQPESFARASEAFIELALPYYAVAALNNGALFSVLDLQPDRAAEFVAALADPRLGGRGLLGHRLNLATLYRYQGRTAELLASMEDLIKLVPPSEALLDEQCLAVLGLALVASDRIPEAQAAIRRVRSAPTVRHAELRACILQTALDCGAEEIVARELAVLQPEPLPALRWRSVIGPAVEAMLRLGLLDDARHAVANPPALRHPSDPFHHHAVGLVALAEGAAADAESQLREAAAVFADVGYAELEARSEQALARALDQLGRQDEAAERLSRQLIRARRRGSLLSARRAREWLRSHGFPADLASAADVRVALEGGADTAPRIARDTLESVIHSLAESAAPREAEAGRLMLEYYVRRAGSQEQVAEKLFLSRPTFYRRLHLGWELVAERLGPLPDGTGPKPDAIASTVAERP